MKQLPMTLRRVTRIWRDSAVTTEQAQEADFYEKALQKAAQEWDAKHGESQVVSFATPAEPPAKEAPDGRE